MILHILRKDLRQLWPLVAMVAFAQILSTALWFALGNFEEPRGLVTVAYCLSGMALFGIVALIASAVHLEVIPGMSQDWLIRPIRRTELMFAKVLFVLVAVHVPMFAGDLAHGLAAGFPMAASLGSAVARSFWMLLMLDAPALALAAMTRSLLGVVASIAGIWFVVMAGILIGILARGHPPPFAGSGLQWMTPTFWSLLALIAAAVIVPIQYLRRATTRSRVVAAIATLLAPALSYGSWTQAFTVQTWLSPDSTAAKTVAIAYDPAIGRSSGEPSVRSGATLLLPLRVSGLLADSWVLNDRTLVRLATLGGNTIYQGRATAQTGYDNDFPVRAIAAGEVLVHQRIVLPPKVYALVRAQSVRMVLDYSLTLLQAEATASVPAISGGSRSNAFGWCRTEIDGDGVELGCLNPDGSPAFVTARLVNPRTGKWNPGSVLCDPDYAPFRVRVFPTGMSRFGGEVRFGDVQGLARYPVDGEQLAAANVTLTAYRPIAHFFRHLVIPKVRLADWAVTVAPSRRAMAESAADTTACSARLKPELPSS
jgi:hypothetical protein